VDAIVVPSKYLVEQFGRHGFDAELIRNAIELGEFEYRAREPLRPVFLSNRQLQSHCNVACILRGFALIQERVRDARLIVASDGEERPSLERLATELELRGTEFTGWVDANQMGGLYLSADIFLNASAFDNIPISITEAFASGMPVVSTDVAGISELVRHGETGMLVPDDDHKQLAATALGLLGDRALASRLARNALRECPQFTWPAVREQWLELYRRLGG
jgi:glycosyltransferase involved in cell wall biosynthesis